MPEKPVFIGRDIKDMWDSVTEIHKRIDEIEYAKIRILEAYFRFAPKNVEKVLGKHIPSTHFPYWMGMMGGYCFDLLAKITGKKLAISSVRVKKFCAVTQFDSTKAMTSGFVPPYTLQEGLARTIEFEFVHPKPDQIEFKSE